MRTNQKDLQTVKTMRKVFWLRIKKTRKRNKQINDKIRKDKTREKGGKRL